MSRKYDREFKLEAVRMASEEEYRREGLSAGIISHWKRQLKNQGDGAFPGTGRLPDRDEEIRHWQSGLEYARLCVSLDRRRAAEAAFEEVLGRNQGIAQATGQPLKKIRAYLVLRV